MSMRIIFVFLLLAVSISSSDAVAGKYNPLKSPGDLAPGFKDLPGVDGKKHSFADYRNAKVKVVLFTCNSCPYAVDYEDRLNDFYNKFCKQGEVALIAINSNRTPADSLEKMKQRAKEKGFRFDYLYDQSQQLARQYGALRTPEFYVLDAKNRIVYMGAFDDNTKVERVKHKYVEQAVQATLLGKQADVKQTPPIGCLIRFKRSRKR